MTTYIAKHLRRHSIAYLALFFALGGTSMAAVNALPKNSVGSQQIKNRSILNVDMSKKTIAALHGQRGPRGFSGATGATGASGAKGDKGDTGAAGPFPGTLPTGKTLRGSFALSVNATAAGEFARDGYPFMFRLAAAPTVHYIASGTTPPAQCPGSVADPEAQAGNLCVYEGLAHDVATNEIVNPKTTAAGSSDVGFYLRLKAAGAGDATAIGTWAVTSP